MKNSVFETELWLPVPIEKVWAFASDSTNLAKVSPKKFGVSVAGSEAGCVDGVRLKINLAPLGLSLPVEWVALLSDVKATGDSRQFVDTQESGPFKYWRHTHVFETGLKEITGSHSQKKFTPAEAGTWVRDRIEYELPLGELGRVVDRFLGRRQLERIFADRRKAMVEHFLY